MKFFDKKIIQNNQDGMASILITILMMIVVSLVVLGFSQVTRTEQRESLNRQLSMQAFYAAESGINDAYSVISSDISTNTAIPSQTSCNPGSTAYSVNQGAEFIDNNNYKPGQNPLLPTDNTAISGGLYK
jgi:Tfp pilus assembly protein PilX